MKHVRTIALAVIAMIGVGFIAIAAAQDGNSANVEVRVWQSTGDAERLYISARPEGGSWATLGTIPLDMSGLNSRETYRYGDITVAVPVGLAGEACVETKRLLESAFADIQVMACSEGGFGHHGAREIAGFMEWERVVIPFTGSYEPCTEDCHPSVALFRTHITFSPDFGGSTCSDFQEWLRETHEIYHLGECSAEGSATYWRDGTSRIVWKSSGRFTAMNGKTFRYTTDLYQSIETDSISIVYQEVGDEFVLYH